MPKATLRIEIGKSAKDYLSVINKSIDHERSKVRITESKGYIVIDVEAEDTKSLLASLNGALKQIRIVNSVDSELSEK